MIFTTLSTAILAAVVATGSANSADPDIVALRQLYNEAVDDARAIGPALEMVETLRAETGRSTLLTDATLLAYQGGIVSLRAKHGRWPPQRLADLRQSLELLDSAVATEPENPEVRYLRLMTCYSLPGIFGRRRSVRDDFAALARLLPMARPDYPADRFQAIVEFVIEHGDLPPPESAALRGSMRQVDG